MKTVRMILLLSLAIVVSSTLLACGPSVPPTLRLELESKKFAPEEPVKLFVLVTGIQLSKEGVGKDNQSGQGHYAIYLGDSQKPIYKGADFPYVLTLPRDTKPGKTSLRVVLLNNDGSPLETNVEQTLEIEVQDTQPVVSLEAENTGVVAGQKIKLDIKTTWFRLRPVEDKRDNKEREGHYKLFLGEDSIKPLVVSHKNQLEVEIPYSTQAGEQVLRLVLYNNDGSKIEPTLQGRLTINVKEPPAPTLKVEINKNEARPGETVVLKITTEHFLLDGKNIGKGHVPGTGHYRIYLDSATGDSYEAQGTANEFELMVPHGIDPGDHSFRVVLFKNDQTPLSPTVDARASFKVLPPPENKPGISVRIVKSEVNLDEVIEMEVTVNNFVLDEANIGKLPKPGTGHFRIYINDKKDKDYLIAGAKTPFQFKLPKDLGAGKYSLRISLRENSGAPLSPPVETKVSVEVVAPKP